MLSSPSYVIQKSHEKNELFRPQKQDLLKQPHSKEADPIVDPVARGNTSNERRFTECETPSTMLLSRNFRVTVWTGNQSRGSSIPEICNGYSDYHMSDGEGILELGWSM
jgi:hypothetical protein